MINVTDVALELVFAPNSAPTVNYSIDADNPPTEDEPIPLVDIDGADIIGATIGDINLSEDANDFDDYFGFVDHSGGRSHILNFTDRPVGAAATDYIFVFGGDALPDVVESNNPVASVAGAGRLHYKCWAIIVAVRSWRRNFDGKCAKCKHHRKRCNPWQRL